MRKIIITTIIGLTPIVSQSVTLTEALTSGQASADVRLRYESVKQDNTK